MKRAMSVAGSFYPASNEEIESYLKYFNKVFEKHFSLIDTCSRAVIVPHAGYIYSGFTANIAYRILQNSAIKRFVVIGPSHRIGFNGISLCEFEEYDTPFGALKCDQEIVKALQENFQIGCVPEAHHEHSTEVQFPFLKHYIPDATLVELVYSSVDTESVSHIIDYLLKQNDIGIIISTDLSHFYTLKEANLRDQICINAIENLNLEKLEEGCEACGMIGVKALLTSAKKFSMQPHIIDYRTSADVSNDTESVVGYVSAYFT
ncbi:AmmeMemoRadiSam system protein B [Sulfurimonas sp. C5]|uniref:AmmeMemoRadiSam system protein B n=1 Tax=Sulfurimonas sp. C5 TaxID=3036947 RepID=UPI00245385B5|nr:AmmeMemoRadiSam system protein B [Sulfurimonas sp. C5]MDH4944409.1 AmmeMemoRadiSam system protein B [Sulfurimonas sp. C5]